MARAPKNATENATDAGEAAELLTSAQVTYVPGEGDPVSVKWMGHTFHAHAPKTVTKPDLIEKAKGNRFFRVGDFDPDKDAGKGPAPAVPKTANEYRAHVVEWLKRVAHAEDIVRNWAGDAALREASGAGTDDFDYLGSLIEPKLHGLKQADGMNDEQEQAMWLRYGVTEIPWRSRR